MKTSKRLRSVQEIQASIDSRTAAHREQFKLVKDDGDSSWIAFARSGESVSVERVDSGFRVTFFNSNGGDVNVGTFGSFEKAAAAAIDELAMRTSPNDVFGGNGFGKEAAYEAALALPLPRGWSGDWFQSGCGSLYLEASKGEKQVKVSIRDHEVSPFRALEFGRPDFSYQISKEWRAESIFAALEAVREFLAKIK